jgi:hypothetical protein
MAPHSVVVVEFPEVSASPKDLKPGPSLSSGAPAVASKPNQIKIPKKVPKPLILDGPAPVARPPAAPLQPTVWRAPAIREPCKFAAHCKKPECKFVHPNWRCPNVGCINNQGHVCHWHDAKCKLCQMRRPETESSYYFSEPPVPSPSRSQSASSVWSPPRSQSAQSASAASMARSTSESFLGRSSPDALVSRAKSDVSPIRETAPQRTNSDRNWGQARSYTSAKPCRFFSSPQGCRRGEACAFVHDSRLRPAASADGRFNSLSSDNGQIGFSRPERQDS